MTEEEERGALGRILNDFDTNFESLGLKAPARQAGNAPEPDPVSSEEDSDDDIGQEEVAGADEGVPIARLERCCGLNCLDAITDDQIRRRRGWYNSLKFEGKRVYMDSMLGHIGSETGNIKYRFSASKNLCSDDSLDIYQKICFVGE